MPQVPSSIPTEILDEILAGDVSGEMMVLLLNDAEHKYSKVRLHGNAKRVYPFWKACEVCDQPYMTHNHTQAHRNRTCSKACANVLVGQANTGLMPIEERKGRWVACTVCGKEIWKPEAWLKRIAQPTCSTQCNGQLRGAEWARHGHKGRAGWTEESEAAWLKKMTGETNPSWKGGVTYRNRKGAYANQKIKYVRCPDAFLPMARKDGYVMEHRLVVAQALGRPLKRSECVHHVNHDATDNRIENLMLFHSNAAHKSYEGGADVKPLWCGRCGNECVC